MHATLFRPLFVKTLKMLMPIFLPLHNYVLLFANPIRSQKNKQMFDHNAEKRENVPGERIFLQSGVYELEHCLSNWKWSSLIVKEEKIKFLKGKTNSSPRAINHILFTWTGLQSALWLAHSPRNSTHRFSESSAAKPVNLSSEFCPIYTTQWTYREGRVHY